MNTNQIKGCSFAFPEGLKVPAAAKSHPELVTELNFGEELTENNWLSELWQGKTVAELGCSLGLRAAYLAPCTRQIFCTDPDARRLSLARETFRLNQRRNVVVVDEIANEISTDVLFIDTRRCSDGSLPEFKAQAPLLIVAGPLPRSTASRVLEAGYEHLPQYHRAAVFEAPRRHHGVQ
ncbi:hypothetical protein [Ruegeria sp. HKCCA0235A]|uniref:hypothetical protein n=1 Tax=Ruegeria sp. HKCCA0235A TaxID=2682998 RepID=UPI0020C291D6|nr:hypothetical protein [Ruegeria sp. HKCCA0235A]